MSGNRGWRAVAALVCVLAAGALAGCAGGGDDGGSPTAPPTPPPSPPPVTTGALTLAISGLPAGTAAEVVVTGPGGFSRVVTESGTVGSLTPGRYTVTPRLVRSAAGAYIGRPASAEVDVAASTTPATASVTYEAAPAVLVLAVSGVPAGGTARVTVGRPGANDTLLTSGTTLAGPAGRWQLTADSLVRSLLTYRATPARVDTTLRGGDTLRLTLQYRALIGSLRLVGNGLPTGVSASAILSVAGAARTVAIPSRVDSLPPGSYTAVTAPFTVNGVRYLPQPLSATTTVTAGDTATALFTFAVAPTVLEVTVGGLPTGTDAAVLLTPPGGSPSTVTATARLTGVTPGSWSWRADTVTTTTARYAATPRTGSLTLAAGDTGRVAVSYALATGSLAVAVTGLPAGTDGAVLVSGPSGFSQSLTATTTLTRLVPGSYTVTAATVQRGTITYTPQPATQTVMVGASLTAVPAAVAYTAAPPGITGLTVTASTLSLVTGQVSQVTPTPAQPTGAPAPTISYGSGNTAVATVSGTGLITAVGAGTTTVTVTATTAATAGFSGASATAAIAVTVRAPVPGVSAVAVTPTAASLTVGGTRQLTPAATQPAGAPAVTYSYGTSAPGVATVSGTGLVTAAAPGTATITVTATTDAALGFSAASVSAAVAVTVSALPTGITGVALAPTSASLFTGGTQQLTPTPTQPAGAPAASYEYGSSATSVATVSGTGLVTAVAPGTATITVTARTAAAVGFSAATVTATMTVTVAAAGPNFQIANAYVVQAVQAANRSTGLVAERTGLLRVFVTASEANSATPLVRVRVYNGATLLRTVTVAAPEGSVRQADAPGVLTSTWNVPLTAAEVVAGLRVQAELDPDSTLGEAIRSDNVWPAGGTPQAFTVTAVPTFTVRFVPVTVGTNTGNITAGNAATFTNLAQQLFPVPVVSSSIRAPFTSSITTLEADSLGKWSTILSEVQALRATDGAAASTYYYGVLKVTYGSGYAGLAYMPGSTGIGWDDPGTAPGVAAHEWGHNFGRGHAPCDVNGEAGYPYAGGVIGQHGWNAATNSVVLPTVTDIMGYCSNQWVSDYTWNGVLQHRATAAAQARRTAARVPGVLVWGRVEDGRVVLEPAFPVMAPATPSAAGGTLRVELVDDAGAPLSALAVQPLAVDHAPGRHFAVVVPLDAALEGRLAGIRVRDVRIPTRSAARSVVRDARGVPRITTPAFGADATVTADGVRTRVHWQGASVAMAMVRDAGTGEVLGFVREPGRTVATGGRPVEVVFSDGVRSAVKRPE